MPLNLKAPVLQKPEITWSNAPISIDAMEDLSSTIPELKKLNMTYSDGTLNVSITVEKGAKLSVAVNIENE